MESSPLAPLAPVLNSEYEDTESHRANIVSISAGNTNATTTPSSKKYLIIYFAFLWIFWLLKILDFVYFMVHFIYQDVNVIKSKTLKSLKILWKTTSERKYIVISD